MTERSDDADLDATLAAEDGVGRSDEPQVETFVRGAAIGRYIVISQVGSGAMGVVLAAYDPQLDRKIALKLIKHRGGPLGRARERLQREAQALAKLDHPNVVVVHDVGVHDEQLFVAMEFVEGQTLGAWMASAAPSSSGSQAGMGARTRVGIRPWREVLEVFVQAGRGLAAAHEAGLVHRDFKPDNVMLSEGGRVRVMDFGLARIDEDASEATRASWKADSLTQTGAIAGTPSYMSLEQFGGGMVDARSDQFGFCVALYEALHGERPFAAATIGELVFALEAGVVREGARSSQVPGWVRAVVLRGLATKPEDRFESMNALLAALSADPVARRRRLAARVGLGLTLAAGAWGIVALSGKLDQRDAVIEEQASELEIKNAELETQLAEQARLLSAQRGLRARTLVGTGSEAEALLLGVQAVGAYADAWTEAPRDAVQGLEQVLAHDKLIVEASQVLRGHTDYLTQAVYSPDGALLATASLDGGVRLWDRARAQLLAVLDDEGGDVFHLAFSPEGRRLATASADGGVRLWDVESGRRIATFEGQDARAFVVAFSPDGTRLAAGGEEHSVRVWSVETRELLFTLAADEVGKIHDLAYTPDGTRLVTAGADAKARVWDASSGVLLATLAGHEAMITALAISPDGTRVATASKDTRARIGLIETGEGVAILEGHEDRVSEIAYSPDGTRVTTVSWDGTGKIHEAETGALVATLTGGHDFGIATLAYAPDGSLATGGFGGSVAIWNPDTGALRARLQGHRGDVWSVAFAPDGRQLATASVDRTLRLWDVGEAPIVALDGPEVDVGDFAYSPDHERLATISMAGRLRLWTADTGELVRTLEEGEDGRGAHLDYAPDGTRLAIVSRGSLRIWDPERGTLLSTTRVTDPEEGLQVAYSPAGTLLLVTGDDLWMYDARTHVQLAKYDYDDDGTVYGNVFSPDDARFAVVTSRSAAQLWDPRTKALADELETPEDEIYRITYSPDGTQIATVGRQLGIRVWDARSLAPGRSLPDSRDITMLRYSPDGARLAAVSASRGIEIWAIETGDLLLGIAPDEHEPSMQSVEFSADGSRFAVLGSGFLRIYESETGELLANIEGHGSLFRRFVFWPDGTRLSSLDTAGALEVWDAETGESLTRERVGIVRADGSTAWPIHPRELTRIGCARLRSFDRTYQQVRDICERIKAP
ncbi:WD40 repeat domain-containing serine/threonine protein kinase [Nannocystaceae bacterium ST9]